MGAYAATSTVKSDELDVAGFMRRQEPTTTLKDELSRVSVSGKLGTPPGNPMADTEADPMPVSKDMPI